MWSEPRSAALSCSRTTSCPAAHFPQMAPSELKPAALLLVDIQYDFLPPTGSLAVSSGLSILPPTYRLLTGSFSLFTASQGPASPPPSNLQPH